MAPVTLLCLEMYTVQTPETPRVQKDRDFSLNLRMNTATYFLVGNK